MTKPTKTTYTLVIDEDRDAVLGWIMAFIENTEPEMFAAKMIKEGKAEVWIGMMEEIGDKNHEMDWCKDPDCKEKK